MLLGVQSLVVVAKIQNGLGVGMGIIVRSHGSWEKTTKSLKKMQNSQDMYNIMSHYGQVGVDVLRKATPKDTGLTASSWSYEIDTSNPNRMILGFRNSNENQGVNIAVILQYGHGTRNGGYVKGIDYINPASQLIFQQMAEDLWSEVKDI